ncbi:MAG: prolyl oligopeptidase family serine peptidase [Acidobacteriota bacterium]
MRQPTHTARWLVVLAAVIAVGAWLDAQPAKRPLSYDVYNGWKSIQGTRVSKDGAWLVYTLAAQEGDGELVVRNLKTGSERRQARGQGALITADDAFVVFTIVPAKADVDKAKKEKQKPEDQPKNGLGIMNLASGDVFTAERVKSFKVAKDSGRFVAYLLEKPLAKPAAEAKKETEAKKEPEEKKEPEAKKEEPAAGDKPKPKEKKKDPGTELVVRELAGGSEARIGEVTDYVWSDDGAWLAYAVSSDAKTPEKDGAFVRQMSDGDTKILLAGLGHYKGLTFDEKGSQLAFLSDRDLYKEDPAGWKLYHWTTAATAAVELASTATTGMPAGMMPSDNGTIGFSKDGGRLFFGCGRIPEPEKPEDAPESVKVDIWHWRDPELQPMQKVRAEQERKRTYTAVIHLKDKRVVALADPDVPSISRNEDDTVVMGSSNIPYRQLVSWDMGYQDYYIVSAQDGSRKKFLERSPHAAQLSPGGTHVVWFDANEADWFAYRVSDGKVVNLTEKVTVPLVDETWDTPDLPRPYGVAGWTEGDKTVLIYDRFDIWEVKPDGTGLRSLTNGAGRAGKIVFRYQDLDPDERAILSTQPLLLRAIDDTTKASGFYRGSFAGVAPAKLIMLDKSVGAPTKAKSADVLLVTAQRFEEFPDLWLTDGRFSKLARVTDANPQQAEFIWGRSELIDYRNSDGKLLRAILTKPEDFDPAKKYPLMVYIYEELSSGLHRYTAPAPGTSINMARYVSNGYVILQPDIVYDVGFPGESAFKCVIPAVQKVVDMGFIDPARIGIQGHSWGGYQITYLITRTDIFRAVQAGASVSNMVSAYGGIRWGSGMSRAFQYERTQSRIGGPPWSKELEFFENSPIFWVEKVNTPYLSIHNDEDDAVPWYQGIEFFSALRRLGKEAYMFNYNTEKHGLRQRENQKHWTIHQDEFFDHFLLGKPKPEWMEKGVPYLERERRDVGSFYERK